MSKWDDGNLEEARLLKKFEDYLEIEKKELDKRNNIQPDYKKFGNWENRFIFLSLIQGVIISGLIISFLFMNFIESVVKIMILLITLGVLGGEIIFLNKYLKNNKNYNKNNFTKLVEKSEFDLI